jgi:plastocyanin
MRIAALIIWVVTALAGATLLSIWLARGGLRRQGQGAGASRFPPALIFGHGLLAASGLVLWIIYLATDTDSPRWVAFAILLVVATLGFTMARLWRQERAAVEAATGQPSTVLPPEQHFPVPLIGLHGLLALITPGPAHRPRSRRPGPLVNTPPGRRLLTWRWLLIAAAAGLLVLSLGQAIIRGDREALALVVVIVVGLLLLRRGTGVLGAVFLSLVFGDFLVWTMWAAMNNLRHGEEAQDVTLPAVLAVLSLTGLVACWAVIARRRQPQAGGLAVAVTPAAAIFMVGMLLGLAVAYPEAPETQRRGAVVAIESANAAFSTTSLAAPAGQVTVVLTNHDLFWHTFTIDELHVDLEAPLGGTREETFTAPPGTYRYYCRVPAHAAAGMRGTLTIH